MSVAAAGGRGRVLLLLGPSAGGVRRVVAHLATGLAQRGWEVTTAGPAGVLAGLCHQDAVVAVPDGARPGAARRARRQVAALSARADLVHAHGLKAGWLAASLRTRPPLVVTLHNVVLDRAGGPATPLLRGLERRLPSRVDRVVAVSAELAGRVADAGGEAAVIPPVAERPSPRRGPGEVRADLGVTAGEPLVVSATRLHAQKDLGTLVRAAARLRSQVPGVRVVVCGEGPERAALAGLIEALGLGETVLLAGWRDHVADDLAAASVVALSSTWEGSPLAVAEAMYLGRPVVATAVGAVPELVEHGRTGLLVPPGDPGALAGALAELLGDPARAEAMGAAGRERVASRLDPERVLDDTEAVYREVLARGARR